MPDKVKWLIANGGDAPEPEVVELVGARHEAPLTHAGHMIRAIEKFLG